MQKNELIYFDEFGQASVVMHFASNHLDEFFGLQAITEIIEKNARFFIIIIKWEIYRNIYEKCWKVQVNQIISIWIVCNFKHKVHEYSRRKKDWYIYGWK